MRLNKDDHLSRLIDLAIEEDIGDGDHSSLASIPSRKKGKSQLIIKEPGILAGVEVARTLFHKIDSRIKMETYIQDGSAVKNGDIAFTVEGRVQSILKAERLVLNIMQRMSGIATQTRQYAEKLEGLNTRLLDTRKTTPGIRILEKKAVELGGGTNHRMGLYDMIMLKDNHVDFAGGISQAIRKTLQYLQKKEMHLQIEIEVRNFQEIREVLDTGGVDRILLDNFSVEDTRKAVEMIGGMFETESSGGITFDTIREYAECGVDYVSVGALTHHINSLDMSLKATG